MLILLVHGLGRTPLSLFGLAAALRRGGHHTRFFGYLPPVEGVPHIVDRLAHRLRSLAKSGREVGLIGHSLGGLFLRMALPQVPELRVRYLVTLGTPHQPPRMARLAWRWLPFRLFTRACGRFLATPEGFDRLPPLRVPYLAIAGTAGACGRFSPFRDEPNDGLVAVSEARVASDETGPVLFPAWHTVMMDAAGVRERVLAVMNPGGTPRGPRAHHPA
jgi:hypothetical protein